MTWHAWAAPKDWPIHAPPVKCHHIEAFAGHSITAHLFELDAPSWDLCHLDKYLSEAEKERAQRFRFAVHARRHRVGRAVARQLLANWEGQASAPPAMLQNWIEGSNGKPMLSAPGAPHFNLSHSGGWAILAISDHSPVGIDMELSRSSEQIAEMATRILTSDEARLFANQPACNQRLLRTWVRKEACLKAIGVGLSHEMNSIQLEPIESSGRGKLTHACGEVQWTDLTMPEDCDALASCAWLLPTQTHIN
jgi:4'-phosphopantetheinyl transferase